MSTTRNRFAAIALALFALTSLVGCSTAARARHTTQNATQLEAPAWSVRQLRGGSGSLIPLADGSSISARFESGTITGESSINTYSAKYAVARGDSVVFTLGPVTKISGPGPLMTQENAYLSALADTRLFRVSAELLELLDAAGKQLVVYGPAAPARLTGQMWYCHGYNNGKGAVVGLIGKSTITIILSADGHVTGSSGVNEYGTSYATNTESMTIDAVLPSTHMSGPKPLVDQERAYLHALRKTTSYRVDGDRLILWDGESQVANYALTR